VPMQPTTPCHDWVPSSRRAVVFGSKSSEKSKLLGATTKCNDQQRQ
jgi:hypothetical protein